MRTFGKEIATIRDGFKIFNFLLRCLEKGEIQERDLVMEILGHLEKEIFEGRQNLLDHMKRVMFAERYLQLTQLAFPEEYASESEAGFYEASSQNENSEKKK